SWSCRSDSGHAAAVREAPQQRLLRPVCLEPSAIVSHAAGGFAGSIAVLDQSAFDRGTLFLHSGQPDSGFVDTRVIAAFMQSPPENVIVCDRICEIVPV